MIYSRNYLVILSSDSIQKHQLLVDVFILKDIVDKVLVGLDLQIRTCQFHIYMPSFVLIKLYLHFVALERLQVL